MRREQEHSHRRDPWKWYPITSIYLCVMVTLILVLLITAEPFSLASVCD